MGELVLAAKITHVPSLMLSEQLEPLKGTRDGPIKSLKLLGQRARERGADTFVVFDTHWISNFGFHINANPWHRGTYTSPEAPQMVNDISYDFPGNPELADLIAAETARTGPLALAHQVSTLPVEYGTIVPMHYMNGTSISRWCRSPRRSLPRSTRTSASAKRCGAPSSSRKTRSRFWRAVRCHISCSPTAKLGPEAWNKISSEFNRQMDLRVLDLWKEGRYAEFCAMLPDYTRKCSGEALMADTVMLFGALGWDGYGGKSEQLCDYFPSSGSGQVTVEFHVN